MNHASNVFSLESPNRKRRNSWAMSFEFNHFNHLSLYINFIGVVAIMSSFSIIIFGFCRNSIYELLYVWAMLSNSLEVHKNTWFKKHNDSLHSWSPHYQLNFLMNINLFKFFSTNWCIAFLVAFCMASSKLFTVLYSNGIILLYSRDSFSILKVISSYKRIDVYELKMFH